MVAQSRVIRSLYSLWERGGKWEWHVWMGCCANSRREGISVRIQHDHMFRCWDGVSRKNGLVFIEDSPPRVVSVFSDDNECCLNVLKETVIQAHHIHHSLTLSPNSTSHKEFISIKTNSHFLRSERFPNIHVVEKNWNRLLGIQWQTLEID